MPAARTAWRRFVPASLSGVSQRAGIHRTTFYVHYSDIYPDNGFVFDEGNVTVQANKDTVFYYVSRDGRGNATVDNVIVGYKNTVAVTNEDSIEAMYAVAKNVWNDSKDDPYWVAEAIVIETKYPVASISKDVALVYNVLNKTYKDYAGVEALDNNGEAADLSVISLNGSDYNKFDNNDITAPWFYTNSVDKSGDSYIRQITENYGAYGIYAAVLDRVNYLANDYVKTVDGKTISLNEETLKVYDIVEKSTYNALDDDDGDLGLKTGEKYIFYTVKGEAVYAIHVKDVIERVPSKTYELYIDIVDDAISGYEKAITLAQNALNMYEDGVNTAEEKAEALNEAKTALKALKAKDLTGTQLTIVNDYIADIDAALADLEAAGDLAAAKAAAKAAINENHFDSLDKVAENEDVVAAVAALEKAIDDAKDEAALEAIFDGINWVSSQTQVKALIVAINAAKADAEADAEKEEHKAIAAGKAAKYLDAIKTELAKALTWTDGSTVKGLVETAIASVTPEGNTNEYTCTVTAPADVSFTGEHGTKTVSVNVAVTNSYAGVVCDPVAADITVTITW